MPGIFLNRNDTPKKRANRNSIVVFEISKDPRLKSFLFEPDGAIRSNLSPFCSGSKPRIFSQVMRRAEAVDLSEQERIGKMVERLENLKRNIVTLTRSKDKRGCGRRCSDGACVCSCALCGEKFGMMLWTSTNLCKDCRKYICQKCSIEATEPNPSKGSDENDATWWRSSLRIIKFAQESTFVQKIIQRSQRQFLCRICAETREMWKKSGAWFFNSMPKYILPEKKVRESHANLNVRTLQTQRASGRIFKSSCDSTDFTDILMSMHVLTLNPANQDKLLLTVSLISYP